MTEIVFRLDEEYAHELDSSDPLTHMSSTRVTRYTSTASGLSCRELSSTNQEFICLAIHSVPSPVAPDLHWQTNWTPGPVAGLRAILKRLRNGPDST